MCQQMQPLLVQIPRDRVCGAHAVGIAGIERIVLGHAHGQRIDAHSARSLPITAAGIVACALDLKPSGCQMAYCVAAQHHRCAGA